MNTNEFTPTELSLADLAAASGIEARTIRSWVAQGILPAPLNRGPSARYPADTLERVLAVRALRDTMGMPLAEIRKELLVAGPERIREYAGRAHTAPVISLEECPRSPVSSAADYISKLRQRSGSQHARPPAYQSASAVPAPPTARGPGGDWLPTEAIANASPISPEPIATQGFEALEHQLGQGRREPARKSRAEVWLRIPIIPDVELTIRGPLEPEQQARLERCADLIRDILLGRVQ